MYYCFHVVFFLLLFVSTSALKMYYIQDLSVMFFKHVVYSLLHVNVALPNKTFHIIITVLISPHVFFSLLKKCPYTSHGSRWTSIFYDKVFLYYLTVNLTSN